MPGIDDLTALLPRGEGAGERLTDELKAAYLAAYPRDYVAFLESYGAGSVDAELCTLVPDDLPVDWRTYGSKCDDVTSTAEFVRDRWTERENRSGEQPPLIAWAMDSSPIYYAWLADAEDPNDWPVVVVDGHDGRDTVIRCGMTDFLVAMFTGGYADEVEYYGIHWRGAGRRFLHNREIERSIDVRIDPWTGKRF